ncbi:MAG: hypothetical protein NWF01_08425 [Candidatus Bathyarchaeota archaeon]|nr:hypothetical protein [Candidatus Bathyarchaeota archaeon]
MTATSGKQFVLPFSSIQKENGATFSFGEELATIYVLSEMERETGAGLIGKPAEQYVSICKVGYPLRVFVTDKVGFVLDGLSSKAFQVTVEDFNVTIFEKKLQARQSLLDTYIAFLFEHADFFRTNRHEKQFSFHGLIANQTFLEEFTQYVKEAKELRQEPHLTLLPKKEATLTQTIKQITDLQKFLYEQASKTQECIKKINELTSGFMEELDFGAGAIKDECNAKIRALEELSKPKIKTIQKQHKKQEDIMLNSFKKKMDELKKQKAKLKKAQLTVQAKIKRFESARSKAERKNLKSERQWKDKIKTAKHQLEETDGKLWLVDRTIKSTQEEKTQQITQLKTQVEDQISLIRKPVRELQGACESKFGHFEAKKGSLDDASKAMIFELGEIAKQVDEEVAKLADFSLSGEDWTDTLYYLPFYITTYQSEKSKRIAVFSPSKVGSVDFSAKLKGALGMAKIRDLLSPRLRDDGFLKAAIAVEVAGFEALLVKGNLLAVPDNRTVMLGGLHSLLDAGWISEKGYEFFKAKLA